MQELSIGLIYWGKRGGGNRFTMNAIRELRSQKFRVIVSLSNQNENLAAYNNLENQNIILFNRKIGILNFVNLRGTKKNLREVFKKFAEQGVRDVVITMPHVFDLYSHEIARQYSIRLTRVIHDDRRHPGDLWPTRFAIRRRIKKSDELIFLSEYVKKSFRSISYAGLVSDFPQEFEYGSKKDIYDIDINCDVLIIGRLRKYKGLQNLTSIVKLANERGNVKFLVAGNGHLKNKETESLRILRGWIPESKFEKLVSNCKVILMLHTQASQSGLPSIATLFGKWIVAPNLAGVSEQVIDGVNGFKYEPKNLTSLTLQLENALLFSLSDKLPEVVKRKPFHSIVIFISSKDRI